MGKFTEVFGGANIMADTGNAKIIKSQPQSDFPTCKNCGGELISVRADFDSATRSSNHVIACKICGKSQ